MKAFLLSFALTGLACAALWHHWRSETAAAPPEKRPLEAVAPPVPAADAATRLTAAKRVWAGVAGKANRKVPITAEHWAALDAVSDDDIAAWAAQTKPGDNHRLWQALMMRWAAIDGRAAMKHSQSGEEGPTRLQREMLTCWLRRDPAGCAAEIKSLRLGDDEVPVFATLAETNLSGALDLIAKMLTSGIKENNEWTEVAHPGYLGGQMRDPARKAEFIRWLKNCRDPITASRVFSVIFNSMEHEDAWLRPDRLPDYMPGRDQLPQTLKDPDTVWAMGALAEGQNPITALRDKAAAPFEERTDAPRHHSLRSRLYAWASRDPESAGLWLKAQSPSPELDEAARGYLLAVQAENPAAAVLWAGTINDPGERVRQTSDHYPRWHRQQPAEAEAWLAAAGFPELHRLFIAGRAAGR